MWIGTLSAQVEKPSWSTQKLEEEQAYIIGTQAFLYYSTPFLLYQVLYQGQQIPYGKYTSGVPFNVWTQVSELGNAQNTRTLMPNVNTLYAAAWLDLRKEPVMLDIAPVGDRYYSIALMDAYMNNFRIIGSRTVGPEGGRFLICTRDYKGPVPSGTHKVESPTPMVWAIQRVAPRIAVPAEEDSCRRIQQGITLRPLGQLDNPLYDPAQYNGKLNLGDPVGTAAPFALLSMGQAFVRENPPPEEDFGLLGSFRPVGLDRNQVFSTASLSEAQRKGLLRGMTAGKEMVNAYLARPEQQSNGWIIQGKEGGNYGTNYLMRAALTFQSIGLLSPDETVYFPVYVDGEGKALHGANAYRIHFAQEQVPKVKAFWSVTLYQFPDLFLYDNPDNRYQVGPQVPGMIVNKDGSLDIYIQHEKPKDKKAHANWLPCPKGAFMMTLRLYNPSPETFKGDGLAVPLPPVERQQ
jgi:hypothetical protein